MKENKFDRIAVIKSLLREEFTPDFLEVIDDSAAHIGHAGNTSGAGHYTIKIKAKGLDGKSRVESHRMVYQVLNHMIGPDIHALRILVQK